MTVFVLADETQLERKLLRDLLSIHTQLTPWELHFCKHTSAWHGNFTILQARTIVLMHAKYFPKQYPTPEKRGDPL